MKINGNHKIIIFDTETTGLPKTKDAPVTSSELWPYIVQFSYIIYDMQLNRVDKIHDFIIKLPTGVDIPEESSKIHGITKEISDSRGIPIKMCINQFMSELDKVGMLVAHNLEFDMNMIIVELIRMNREADLIEDDDAIDLNNSNYEKIIEMPIFCTMRETEKMCNIKAVSKNGKEYTKFPTLGELHFHLFRSYPKNLHNSLNDILVCLRCYYYLKMNSEDICNRNVDIKQMMVPLL